MAGRTSPDQIFNRSGRRHFRRTYSRREVRFSVVIVLALAMLLGWIYWRGLHPDPELFSAGASLLAEGDRKEVHVPSPVPAIDSPSTAKSQLPLTPVAMSGDWSVIKSKSYSPDEMYVKINGRASFYQSFGCKRLIAAELQSKSDASKIIDIELYEMQTVANALGVYAGERQPEVQVKLEQDTLYHRARNALFLARGGYYLRAIGSDESPAVLRQLEYLQGAAQGQLPRQRLPWAYALFVGTMGLAPDKLGFFPENAFSLDFARQVYVAQLKDGGEAFATLARSDKTAAILARRYHRAFLELGERVATKSGTTPWIKERYINTLSNVDHRGRLVVGVRRVDQLTAARRALTRLQQAAAALPSQALQETDVVPSAKGIPGDEH
jgi:hypothetical protein